MNPVELHIMRELRSFWRCGCSLGVGYNSELFSVICKHKYLIVNISWKIVYVYDR